MVLQNSNEMPPCVILTEGVVGQTLGMIRSIGRRGVPVYVLIIPLDSRNTFVCAKSRYCKTVHALSSFTNSDDLCTEVLDWLDMQGFHTKPVLFPITDKICTYLAEGRERLSDKFNICMASDSIVLDMLDKEKADVRAETAGLKVPETHSATSPSQLESLILKCGFPVIVKPTWWRKSGKRYCKGKRCDSQEELLDIGGRLIKDGATILIQQYIPGNDDTFEIYMFYRTSDGQMIHECTGQKFRQIPPEIGVMASGQATQLPHVAQMSQAFLKQVDYRGLGGIEYKRHNNMSYFIEMSVRPECFHALAIKAGIDLPWLAYSDMALGHSGQSPKTQKKASYINVRSHISLWYKHRNEVPALREILKVLWLGKVQFDLWSWRDPMPWLKATGQWLKELIIRMKTKLLH